MAWDVAVAFNASIASYKKYGKPIAPTRQAYDKATPADMARFVQLCKSAGITHVSCWDWQHSSADQLAGIKANLVKPPAPVPAPISILQAKSGPATDVAPDTWYANAVSWSIQEGVMHNNPDGTFMPDQPLTRAQAAQLMYNNYHRN